jgi:hypothetical protein
MRALFERWHIGALGDVDSKYFKRALCCGVASKSGLKECDWKVRGKGGAAERLGLKRTTLQSRMKKLGIQRPSP